MLYIIRGIERIHHPGRPACTCPQRGVRRRDVGPTMLLACFLSFRCAPSARRPAPHPHPCAAAVPFAGQGDDLRWRRPPPTSKLASGLHYSPPLHSNTSAPSATSSSRSHGRTPTSSRSSHPLYLAPEHAVPRPAPMSPPRALLGAGDGGRSGGGGGQARRQLEAGEPLSLLGHPPPRRR